MVVSGDYSSVLLKISIIEELHTVDNDNIWSVVAMDKKCTA